MSKRISYKLLCFFVFLFASKISWAYSIYIYSDAVLLPTSILKGKTATAYYVVYNNTSEIKKANYVRYLPPNVTQVVKGGVFKNTCGAYFDLDTLDNRYCILQLTITGAVDSNDPEPSHHLMVCQGESDCSGVDDKKDELNVIEGKANELARVAVVNEHTGSPSAFIKPVAYTSTDGGIGWTPHNIAGSAGLIRAVTCKGNNGQSCVAVGDAYVDDGRAAIFYAYTSTDGGVNWTSHSLGRYWGAAGLSAVTCNGSNGEFCVAVGGYTSASQTSLAPIIYTSRDGGINWTSHFPVNQGKSALRAVSCSEDGQYCTAVGDFNFGTRFISYTSTDGGITWAPHVMGGGAPVSILKAVTCNGMNGQRCIAVGYTGENKPVIYLSENGGVNWKSFGSQKLVGVPKAITCNKENNQNCMMVGSFYDKYTPIVYTTSNGGISWELHYVYGVYNFRSFESVACDSKGRSCTITGYALTSNKITPIIYRTINNGNHWVGRSSFANENDPVQNIEYVGISVSTSSE